MYTKTNVNRIPLRCITLHYITLHYIALHYIALHCMTLHCIALHYITLRYLTLPYIIWHYLTLHTKPNHTLPYLTIPRKTIKYLPCSTLPSHHITLHDRLLQQHKILYNTCACLYNFVPHTHTRAQTVIIPFIFFPFVIFCSYIDVIFLSISACSMNLSTSSSVTGFSSHCTSLKDNTTSNSHISLHISCIFRGSAVMVISMGKLHVAAEFLQANWMVKPAAILLPEAFHARFLLHVRAGWGLQHAFGGGDTVDLGTRWVDVGGDHGPGHYGLLPLGWSLCPAECGRLGGALAPKKRTPLGCFMRGYYEKVSDYQLVIVEMVGWLIDCDVFECWNLIDWLVGNGAAGENHRLLN